MFKIQRKSLILCFIFLLALGHCNALAEENMSEDATESVVEHIPLIFYKATDKYHNTLQEAFNVARTRTP